MKKILFSVVAPVLAALALLTGPDLGPPSQARAAAVQIAPFVAGPFRSREEAESRAHYWRSRGHNAIVWSTGGRIAQNWYVTISRPQR
jgi:hypothetical protein